MDSSKRLPSLSRGSNSLYSKTQSDGDVHSPHPDCSIPYFSVRFSMITGILPTEIPRNSLTKGF